MRLAVEVSACSAQRAGIGYYTEHLVDALAATAGPGDELVLISNAKPAPELYARWEGRLRLGGLPVRAVWMQRDVGRLLREVKADFAVFPNYLAPLLEPICPFVTIVHDLAIFRRPQFFNVGKRALQRPLLPMVVRRAAAVGTVSAASRRDVIELLEVPEDRILMLPGAPHPACRPAEPGEVAELRARYGLARPYVLTVGTLEPRKNLPTLLRSFDRLLARAGTPAAELDLVVVGGRGWRDRELLAEISRRRSTGRLHTLGYVPERDLVTLYGGAEVLAYPSHFEGFGLPVIESMACGTPVVATDVPALREVSAGAARLVPVGDEVSLAGALAEMIEDPTSRAEARRRGLERAAAFTWEGTAERLWQFARETVGARGHVPSPAAAPQDRKVRPVRVGGMPPRSANGEANGGDGSLDPDWALFATILYADLFDAPITVEEAARTCLGAHLTAAEVRARANVPPLSELVTLDPEGHLTLKGRETLVARRQDGIRRTNELLARHRPVISALANLPFVRMLALSGGTAHRNARGKDDIDLFVVAAAGRAYTAYTMLYLASVLTRRRGIVCPNYLVDEGNLRIAYHHDLFTAHQAVSLVPIAGLETFDRFVDANRGWVRAFYPSYAPRPPGATLGAGAAQRMGETVLGWKLGEQLERLLSVAWRLHLGRRAAWAPRADLVLDPGILKLHLSDHRRNVLALFEERLESYRRLWPRTGERRTGS